PGRIRSKASVTFAACERLNLIVVPTGVFFRAITAGSREPLMNVLGSILSLVMIAAVGPGPGPEPPVDGGGSTIAPTIRWLAGTPCMKPTATPPALPAAAASAFVPPGSAGPNAGFEST